jgi:hypothetical protein
MMHWISILLLGMLAAPAAAADAVSDEELSRQRQIYQSRGEQRPEGYVVGRSLLSYSGALSADFMQSLAALGSQDRWLDVGAGEGRAILDYRTSKYDVVMQGQQRPGEKAKATAISIEDRRTAEWHQTAAAIGAQEIQYLAGRRLREYSLEELGKFKLISDVFGGFSYTRDLTLFMEKALGFLEVKGIFYTVLQDVHWQEGDNRPFYAGSPFLTELKNADGSEMKVCTWLQSISCVEVTCESKDASPPVEMYRVNKVCDDVRVPKVNLVHFQAGTPPERRFTLSPSEK